MSDAPTTMRLVDSYFTALTEHSIDADDLITEIREYANPVPIAPIFGVPLGSA